MANNALGRCQITRYMIRNPFALKEDGVPGGTGHGCLSRSVPCYLEI